MGKTVSIHNMVTDSPIEVFYSRLEQNEFDSGPHCFNCQFCGDIETATGDIKDAIIQCLGKQSGVEMKLGDRCHAHQYIENYQELRKGD